MDYTIIAYSIYLLLAIGLTVWVAQTLLKNGKVFLIDIFHGQEELAISLNRLLQIGFYLISLGTMCLRMTIDPEQKYNALNRSYTEIPIATAQKMIEVLSYKVGGFTLILGLLFFFNLFILLMLRSSANPKTRQKAETGIAKHV